ncbi:MAG: glycoside hydrolase family 16 protein [Halieaceae bacterium]|jgi:beta-glucanase (GH16 family)|nr:glycoside hydrolase family 16 protein [Halieaceae bacterium]
MTAAAPLFRVRTHAMPLCLLAALSTAASPEARPEFSAEAIAAPLSPARAGDAIDASKAAGRDNAGHWEVDFFDDFDHFDARNWQDQMLWVNDEDQCYVPDARHGTREVSDGTLKLRMIDIGEALPCANRNKDGELHPPTRYFAARIASKNRREFVQGRWTARLRVADSGQHGMFPAWWLLGALNDEPPVEEADETVCWPLPGSGEIDIFEHHSDGGPDHYAARIIESNGECGGGDWQASMLVHDADLDAFHEYAVAWDAADMLFLIDGQEIYRLEGKSDLFREPLFAILNFAKIFPGPMNSPWVMEVDWVRHERWIDAGN